MPRKNKPEIFSAGISVARVKEDTRMSRRQDSLTDVIRRNTVHTGFPNPYTRGIFEHGFIQQSIFGHLNPNLYLTRNVHENHHHCYDLDQYVDDDDSDYEDDDDDDEDEFEDARWAQSNTSSPLQPHPRLRPLTQEEADKHTKEQQEREERRKAKTERQKLKKLRRKEKKRLEKEQKNKERLCELEQNQPSGSHDEDIISNTSTIMTEQSDVAAETEDNSVDGDSTRSSEDPDERIKAADIKSFISPSTRGQSHSPVTGERKGGGGRKNNKKKKTKNSTSRERRAPDREASPVVSQTPPLPRDAGADKKENMNGNLEDYSQKMAELAALGHRLASCGQYEQALEYFTEAIKYNPKEYKLFGNRSFCYERLRQYESALQDSEVALSLEPGWIKGLFRRGKALCGLKRYYDASLTYKNILRQESSSVEASSELKRAQTLHLMEMGFSWTEACEALKEHGSLEEALEALFIGGAEPEEGSCRDTTTQLVKEEEGKEEEEEAQAEAEEDEGWKVLGRSRPHQARRRNAASPKRVNVAPVNNGPKWEMYSVWVGSLAPTLTMPALHNLFNRAGHVTSVKMLVEQQCAFVNYTRMEDCDRAIQLMDGLLVEGTPLAVRYPNRFLIEMNGQDGYPRPASRNTKECFHWRTNGCTKLVGCIFKHIPEHKHIDRDKLRP